ncbi:MAG: hypothetical protein C4318_00455 [Acidimicrobiia bacterium]
MLRVKKSLEDQLLLDAWNELASVDLGPFVRPEWARVWRRHFGDSSELLVMTAMDNLEGRPWGIWALELFDNGTIEQLGGREVTDYSAPAVRKNDVERFARELAEYLYLSRTSCRKGHLEAVPANFGFSDTLADELLSMGAKVRIYFEEVCPVLELPGSYAEYLASLTSKHRHELRRKIRRFEAEVGKASVEVATQDSLEKDLEDFFYWHRNSRGPKGGFLDSGYEAFFRDIASTAMEKNWLRLTFLKAGAKRYSACFGFELADSYFLYNSAHDPDATKLSPGIVHIASLIQKGIERGLRRFDFLQGAERYKIELGGKARMLATLDFSWE